MVVGVREEHGSAAPQWMRGKLQVCHAAIQASDLRCELYSKEPRASVIEGWVKRGLGLEVQQIEGECEVVH